MPDELQLRRLESLWREFQSRLSDSPDFSIAAFAVEHPSISTEIHKLFPLMSDLKDFARDPIPAPDQIGPYSVVRQIGVGGMGVVYEAESDSLRERVAIKLVDPAALVDANRERLRREAKLAATLHHSHIVPVYDVGTFENNEYFTMKYIDGPNLSEVLHQDLDDYQERSPREQQTSKIATELAGNWNLQARMMRDAAEAIAYAHRLNVLHRDVKPANFLVDDTLKLWVTDFGLAKVRGDDNRDAVRSQVIGTPRYMAPEQMRGESDERSDIFGLGLTMYEMALLQSHGNRRMRIWHGGLQPPSTYNEAIPGPLESIIMRAVSLDPSQRQSSAQEVAEELGRFIDSSDASISLNVKPHSSMPEEKLSNQSLSSRLSVLVLVTTVLATAWFVGDRLFPDRSRSLHEPRRSAATITGQIAKPAEQPESNPLATPLKPTNSESIDHASFDSSSKVNRDGENQPPSFASHMFNDRGKTINISKSNARFPTALDVQDDRDTAYAGMNITISGGADASQFAMTPFGVLAFLHDERLPFPDDHNQDGFYELEVAARDEATVNYLRLVRSSDCYQLLLDQLAPGAEIESTVIATDIEIPGEIVDIATADGVTFYQVNRSADTKYALYQATLSGSGEYSSLKLSDDCGLRGNVVGIATLDGKSFHVASQQNGSRTSLALATLQDDGTFSVKSMSRHCLLSPQLEGLSCLDGNRFQHIRPQGSGGSQLYLSFLVGTRFVNMQVNDELTFGEMVVGQAAWAHYGSESNTTVRSIQIQFVD